MTCASAWMEAALTCPGWRLVAYGEAWRVLRHLPLVRRRQAQWSGLARLTECQTCGRRPTSEGLHPRDRLRGDALAVVEALGVAAAGGC